MFFFSWTADLQILQIGRANGEWYDHNKIILSSQSIRKQASYSWTINWNAIEATCQLFHRDSV